MMVSTGGAYSDSGGLSIGIMDFRSDGARFLIVVISDWDGGFSDRLG